MQVQDVKRGKNKQRVLKAIGLVAIVATCSLFVQCDDGDATSTGANDYYPLREGSSWEVLYRLAASGYHTVLFKIDGDTIINGLTYKKLFGGDHATAFLRKDGGKYYARDVSDGRHFSEEYLFLNENAPVGTTCMLSSFRQYKVIAVNSIRTINGLTYDEVIEMQVNGLDGSGITYGSATIYYAKGVGEIYSWFPAYLSGAYGEIEKILVKYTP